MRKIEHPDTLTTAHAGPGGLAWINGTAYVPDAPTDGTRDPHAALLAFVANTDGYTITANETAPDRWDDTVAALRAGDTRRLAQLAIGS